MIIHLECSRITSVVLHLKDMIKGHGCVVVFRVLPNGGGMGEILHRPKFSEFPPPPSPNSLPKKIFLPHKILISSVFLVEKEEKKKMAQNFFARFE